MGMRGGSETKRTGDTRLVNVAINYKSSASRVKILLLIERQDSEFFTYVVTSAKGEPHD